VFRPWCWELRVKLHALLRWLLSSAEAGISAYASDAVEIMDFTVEDAHSDVLVEACKCLEVLVQHLGRRLQPVSKKLAWTFTPNLTHKRAKVGSTVQPEPAGSESVLGFSS